MLQRKQAANGRTDTTDCSKAIGNHQQAAASGMRHLDAEMALMAQDDDYFH